jgi:lysozyme
MNHRDIAKAQIMVDEGERLRLYKCSAGKWTIGYGRNVEDRGITKAEALYLLENDITQAEFDASVLFPSFARLSDNRKAVLVNMALNLGRDRLAGFKDFRQAVEAGAWEQAAAEMLDSKWAKQTGNRAIRLAKQMKEG